jgi:hypothetical protein
VASVHLTQWLLKKAKHIIAHRNSSAKVFASSFPRALQNHGNQHQLYDFMTLMQV